MSDTAAAKDSGFRYGWWSTAGDLNGFFGVLFDNITTLAFVAYILMGMFDMPKEIVFGRIFPGTAFGVLLGDCTYTWLAFRTAKRLGRNVTAMPLGIDTPSSIGMAMLIVGPCYKAHLDAGMPADQAALQAWYVGMASLLFVGITKFILAWAGNWINRIIPLAGLMGSLGGVGITLIAFSPIQKIFGAPLVGMIALGFVLCTLIARIKLPYNAPGVLVGVVVGTILYYLLQPLGIVGGSFVMPDTTLNLGFPLPSLGFLHGMAEGINYLPLCIPFAILVSVGGINVTQSARLAGDDYNTRDVLLVDACCTMVAAICGGVAQPTPYLGQPAYKAMGARGGYTLLTGITVGLCGMFGIIGLLASVIPAAVLAPVLVFVGLSIVCQAFNAVPAYQSAAVAFAFAPNIARLLCINTTYDYPSLLEKTGQWINDGLVNIALGNGFILTAMLWGAFVSLIIERRYMKSIAFLILLAVFSFFGVIHSVDVNGAMYLPWHLESAAARAVPYQFALGYLGMAALLLWISCTKGGKEPVPEDMLKSDGTDMM